MIIFCSSSGDHRDRAAAGWPLMLGAAGDVDETGARVVTDLERAGQYATDVISCRRTEGSGGK